MLARPGPYHDPLCKRQDVIRHSKKVCYSLAMSIALAMRCVALAASFMAGTFGALANDMPTVDLGPGLPTGLCQVEACSPVHLGAWSRFQAGSAIDDLPLPALYSGICWVLGPSYNPHHRHHVGLIIDQFGERIAMGLRLSFFSKKQPFIALDRRAALELFDDTPMPLIYGAGYGYADASDVAPFRYWVRRDGMDPKKLALMGYFGFRHTILCSLRDNASYR